MSSSEASWHEALSSNFLKARELDPASRAEFIKKLRETDSEMSSWIERMIDAEDRPSPLFSGSSCGPVIKFAAPDMTDTRIGRYTVKRRIGAGGMGSVYEAIQDKPQRNVAVKVLPGGLFSTTAARRFEYESSVLARLHHPGIAQIIEAGIHREGSLAIPFIAMELVPDATPITTYITAKHLGVRETIALFIQVCEAIQYGHRRGIIHRDLKPDNILIDRDGSPRIIDFGVARAIDRDGESLTIQTEAGQLVGTIPYMSPEQISGGQADLDIRTDVYSLGVVLFELLTGRLPYEMENSVADAIRVIQGQEPARASSINRSIPYDVDTIVAKALSKDRDQRYATVAEFSADLRHFLGNEPISARPPTFGYQFRKFAQRHKALVGALSLALLATVGGFVAERLRANEAIEARNAAIDARKEEEAAKKEAQGEAAKAKTVVAALGGMLQEATPDRARGEEPTMQEVLDTFARQVDQGMIDSPEVEATIRLVIGNIYERQSRFGKAKSILEKAVKIHNSLGLHNEETLQISLSLAIALLNLGDFDQAAKMLDHVDAIARESKDAFRGFALSAATLRASLLAQTGRTDEAIRVYKSTIASVEQLKGKDDALKHSLRATLGSFLAQAGRYEEAVEYLKPEIEWNRNQPSGPTSRILNMQRSLARAEIKLGHADESFKILNDAVAEFARDFGTTHPDMADALEDLGRMYISKEKYSEAEPRLRQAIEIHEALYGKDHVSICGILNALVRVVASDGRISEAIELQSRALRILENAGQTNGDLYTQGSASLATLRGLTHGPK